MTQPRLASARLDLASFAKYVFRTSVEEWSRLPAQWRGFVLNHQHTGETVANVLARIDRGELSNRYDPQGVYDTFTGIAPE